MAAISKLYLIIYCDAMKVAYFVLFFVLSSMGSNRGLFFLSNNLKAERGEAVGAQTIFATIPRRRVNV